MEKSVRFVGLSLTIAVVFTVLSMGLAAQVSAIALDENSTEFLGYIDPNGGSEATEAAQINILIAQPLNSGPTTVTTAASGTNAYTRTGNSCGTCPLADDEGAIKDDTGAPTGNDGNFGDGFDYLKAKYGTLALIWYVADLDGQDFTVPLDVEGGGGLSHWVLFNPNGTSVAEPSTTLLAGLAFAGIAFFGRKFLPKA